MSDDKTVSGSNPSMGARKAAEVITGGTYGDTKRYNTTYGTKTVQGVAAVIDREANITDMVKTLKGFVDNVECFCEDLNVRASEDEQTTCPVHEAERLIKAAEG